MSDWTLSCCLAWYTVSILIQVSLFQKHLFLYHLTHSMTKYFSLNYEFSTWKFQAQNMLCTHIVFLFLFWHSEQFMYTTCSELGIFMYWTRNTMNNLSSYCGLVDARIGASDKYLPVIVLLRRIFMQKKKIWNSHDIYIVLSVEYLPIEPWMKSVLLMHCFFPRKIP